MICNIVLLIISIALFIRQVKIDSRKYWKEYCKRDRLGDLHILTELRKYYIENNIPGVEKFDQAIEDLQAKINVDSI